MRTTVLLLGWILATAAALAQSANSAHTLKFDSAASRPPAILADVAWLEGHWTGTGFGAHVEEIWTGVDGQSLLGMFRLVQAGQPRVYEIVVIVEEGGSLAMRLKHFTGELKGWEEKDKFITFPLVKLEPNTAYFDGLTYRLEAGGTLRVWLVVGHKDAPETEEELIFQRVK